MEPQADVRPRPRLTVPQASQPAEQASEATPLRPLNREWSRSNREGRRSSPKSPAARPSPRRKCQSDRLLVPPIHPHHPHQRKKHPKRQRLTVVRMLVLVRMGHPHRIPPSQTKVVRMRNLPPASGPPSAPDINQHNQNDTPNLADGADGADVRGHPGPETLSNVTKLPVTPAGRKLRGG